MQQPPIEQASFRRSLLGAVLAPLILMALLATALLWQIDSYRVATRAVVGSDQTIARANLLQKLLVDMETGLRGYLLTGADTFLTPYNQALPQIGTIAQDLNTRVADQPDQAERLRQTLQDYGQWRQYAQRVLQLRKDGGDYTSIVASGAGKQIMDDIRAQIGAFVQSEETVRDMRANDAQQTAQVVIYTSLALILVLGALLAFFSRSQLVILSRSYDHAFALAREQADEAAEQRERLRVTLASIGDAVIVTDTSGTVTFVNPVAQALTGWSDAEAQGQPLERVFPIINEETRAKVENPVAKVIREGRVIGLANHTVLIARDGAEAPIDDSAAPIRDSDGNIAGVVLVFRDIAERKRAEQTQARLAAMVDEQRQRLNNIIASVPGVVWESWGPPGDGSQRIGFVSDYVEMLLGYSTREWLSTPNFWLTIVHPDDREQAAAQAATTFASKRPGINQFRWIARDGRVLWVETHSTAILDGAGRPVGMRGVTMDITKRKLAEEAIKQSEQRYRELADAMPLVVWTAKPNGFIDYYNQRWFDYTGLTYEQSHGWGWQPVIHPDDLPNTIVHWSQAVNTGQPYEIEYRWRRTDGVYRWQLGRALPVRDDAGEITYWVGTGTDIEEQKHAEDQQRLLAETSVLLVNSLDYASTLSGLARLIVPRLADWCAVHILEESGEIRRLAFMHSNAAKQAMVNERPERYSLDPSARHIVPYVLSTGEPELFPEVTDALLVEAARDQEHLQTLRALGFTSYMCLPMVARGHILGTITFVTAESGRHYDEAALALGEDLASRAAIALDNARLYRDAQDAIRARDRFLSIASHELKTPLTSLMGYVDLMQRRAARSNDLAERDQRAIRVVGEQAHRLNKLVSALLDLSRIETGQLSIERGLVDLGALARRLVQETQPTTDRHTIVFSGASRPVMLLGDELRLEQVVQNLIQNAIKYSPNGGPIRVLVERIGDKGCIRVSDAGIGIPAAALPQLFRRFYRAPNADTQHISGMGIGLYVVKEIVELHGGTVDANSVEGQGSTFTICLPLLTVDK
ncbi:MAG TPA: PAS domain S-box protein [Roseiflexaceae bacterium]|nr:PAS domain S-box protein [Roseiflexaceae bacterium]